MSSDSLYGNDQPLASCMSTRSPEPFPQRKTQRHCVVRRKGSKPVTGFFIQSLCGQLRIAGWYGIVKAVEHR